MNSAIVTNIDTNKIYEAMIIDVKDVFRAQYGRPGLKFTSIIKGINQPVTRTFTLPSTLQRANKLTNFLSSAITQNLSDDLLGEPEHLAKVIARDMVKKCFKAKLSPNKAGTHINIEQLLGLVNEGMG